MRKKILAISISLICTTAFAQNSNNQNVVNSFLNNQSIDYLKSTQNQANKDLKKETTVVTPVVAPKKEEPKVVKNISEKIVPKKENLVQKVASKKVIVPVKKEVIEKKESVECYPIEHVEHRRKIIHHFYKKHIIAKKFENKRATPIMKKPIEQEITLVNQEKNVLVSTNNFFIPNNKDNHLKNWEKPLTYQDIHVNFEQNPKTKEITISFFNNRNHIAVDSNELNPIVGNNVHMAIVKSDLSKSNDYSWNVQNDWKYNPEHNSCSIITVSYHLFGEKDATQVTKYIGHNNLLSNELPNNCEKNQEDLRETTFYTKQDNVVDVALNQHQLDQNKFDLNEHFINDGQDFFPSNLKTYLMKTDLSVIYLLSPENNPKGPYFGVNYLGHYPKGNYYLISTFGVGDSKDHIKTEISIK